MFGVGRPELAWWAAIAGPSSRRTTAPKNVHRRQRPCPDASSSSEERRRDPIESPSACAGDARGSGRSTAAPSVSGIGSRRAPDVWRARGSLSRERDYRPLRRSHADDRSGPRRQEPGSTRSRPLESRAGSLRTLARSSTTEDARAPAASHGPGTATDARSDAGGGRAVAVPEWAAGRRPLLRLPASVNEGPRARAVAGSGAFEKGDSLSARPFRSCVPGTRSDGRERHGPAGPVAQEGVRPTRCSAAPPPPR